VDTILSVRISHDPFDEIWLFDTGQTSQNASPFTQNPITNTPHSDSRYPITPPLSSIPAYFHIGTTPPRSSHLGYPSLQKPTASAPIHNRPHLRPSTSIRGKSLVEPETFPDVGGSRTGLIHDVIVSIQDSSDLGSKQT